MHIFFILSIVSFLVAFVPVKNEKGFKIRTIMSLLPFFFYGALRYKCMDYNSYELIFENAKHAPLFQGYYGFEEVWGIFNKILPSFRYAIVIHTTIVYTAYYFVITRVIHPKEAWLFMLLLSLVGDKSIYFMYTAMQNAIAIALLMLSMPLIKNRNWKLFTVMTLLAGSFHTSALAIFPMCYLMGRNNDFSKKELMAYLIIIISLFILPVDNVVNTIAPLFLSVNVFGSYSVYLEQESTSGFLTSMAGLIMAMFVFSYLKNQSSNIRTKKSTFVANDYYIFRLSLLFIIFLYLGVFNARGSQYFFIFLILSAILTYRNSSNILLKYGYIAFVALYFAFGLKINMGGESSGFVTFYSLIQ